MRITNLFFLVLLVLVSSCQDTQGPSNSGDAVESTTGDDNSSDTTKPETQQGDEVVAESATQDPFDSIVDDVTDENEEVVIIEPTPTPGYTPLPATNDLINTLTILPASKTEVVEQTVCKYNTLACIAVNKIYNAGQAAGNVGDWYDNNDGFHAGLEVNPAVDPFKLTQLLQVKMIPLPYVNGKYCDDRSTVNDCYGNFYESYAGKVVIGNASLANPSYKVVNGEMVYQQGTSYPRVMMIQSRGTPVRKVQELLYDNQYMNNHWYFHPAHLDYMRYAKLGLTEPFKYLAVDFFHAYPLYNGVSLGSSGSEMNGVRLAFLSLAALKPDVKAKLKAEKLLIPTMQMVWRRILGESEVGYLSSKAHPTAFSNWNDENRNLKIISAMNSLTVDKLPPIIKLAVLSDEYYGNYEEQFTTPNLISRIHYGMEVINGVYSTFPGSMYRKKITLSAKTSYDLNGKPLTYHWRVLNGDASKVKITPTIPGDYSEVEIEVTYFPTQISQGPSANHFIHSNRIDVGAFVHNGFYYSSPAYFSVYTAPNERREYDAQGELECFEWTQDYIYNMLMPSFNRYSNPPAAACNQ